MKVPGSSPGKVIFFIGFSNALWTALEGHFGSFLQGMGGLLGPAGAIWRAWRSCPDALSVRHLFELTCHKDYSAHVIGNVARLLCMQSPIYRICYVRYTGQACEFPEIPMQFAPD